MYRKKLVTGIAGLMAAAVCVSCGSSGADAEINESAAEMEEVSEVTATESDEAVVEEEPAEEETEETDAVLENEEEQTEEEGADNGRYMLGDAELENIVQQYDEVLSNYDLECYFGYNKPDDGWVSDWDDVDGRQEGKERNQLRTADDETLYIDSFEIEPTRIVSIYNDDGNEVEVQADTYEYECRYSDAIRAFCQTGEWEEPERCQNPYHGGMSYCIDRKPAGKIDTPYGEGTLYSAVYEYVGYEEYDEEGACWTKEDEASRSWSRREGMVIEIDNYFVTVELSASDWYVWDPEDADSGKGLSDIEYTGRLEELLPQMFETK